MPFSLYFHMPFCRRKCPYCDFYKLLPKSGDIARFSDALQKELVLAGQQIDWVAEGPLETVYFGGGTPSLHAPSEIGQLLELADGIWGIVPDAEITLEINPGTLVKNDFVELVAIGINRLSVGAQSFTNRKISLLYRDHEIPDTRRSAEWARTAGFSNLSLDLIFGLPDETLEEWRRDIQCALELEPEHISLYNLEYHTGTPIDRWRKSGKWQPLGQDLEAEMYLLTHNLLTASGFQHYEVSNFAKEGFRAVHNAAYWKGLPHLGLGPSAFSFDGVQNRHANAANIDLYRQKVDAGELPVDRRWTNTSREQDEEWISGCLRQTEGIVRHEAETRIGKDMTDSIWNAAKDLPENHLELNDTAFRLTPEGWFVENEVLGFLFERL